MLLLILLLLLLLLLCDWIDAFVLTALQTNNTIITLLPIMIPVRIDNTRSFHFLQIIKYPRIPPLILPPLSILIRIIHTFFYNSLITLHIPVLYQITILIQYHRIIQIILLLIVYWFMHYSIPMPGLLHTAHIA